MSDIAISIEGIGPELLEAYEASGMDRGRAGAGAIAWAFASNPRPFAVARQDGVITGVSAYILSRMRLGTATGTGLQAVDSFVSGAMRGKGVFTRLARAYDAHAAESGADLVWGFPNDNAAPAWFGKLGWGNFGQVPFLIKPLRAGYLLRKAGLHLDFPVTFSRDQHLPAVTAIGEWADVLWERAAAGIGCGSVRDRAFLSHRLLQAPQAGEYRVVADTDPSRPALVATRVADKHGGRIGYLMEALGGPSLSGLLHSELGRMRDDGADLVLAWCFPWSPNYRMLRRAGFLPLSERLRPIRIWFGSRPKTAAAARGGETGQWYLSYLDSDTV